jgi:hypothetical protein
MEIDGGNARLQHEISERQAKIESLTGQRSEMLRFLEKQAKTRSDYVEPEKKD